MQPSEFPDPPVGDRLRRLRRERGLTQEQLAERAGVSVDLVKKLEQGQRQSARLTSLTALALALDVARSELLDKRPRIHGESAIVLNLRDVLLSVDLLPGIDPKHDDGTPTPAQELWTQVRTCWRAYWDGQFVDLAQTVPALIAEARVSSRSGDDRAAGPLAQAYQLAACLLIHLGREDLAAIGAERGIAAAADSGDELQWATLHGTYCWALLSQARHAEAERLAMRVAERIEPRFTTAPLDHLTVWGGLVLWALAAAAEAARGDAVADYIALARVGAARFDADRHDYQVNFGPTQVAMQTAYAHAMLGRPDHALAAAGAVQRQDLQTISYGRHLLDLAQAHTEARHYDDAEGALKNAKDVAPVWFRHQILARTLVADLAERRPRVTPVIRELIESLDHS